MSYFWRIAHAVTLFAGFALEFAAACKVDNGATITSVMPLIIGGLVLMVALKPLAAYEEWCEVQRDERS